jgi:GMP synthase-like glutamine amidotransferase
MKPIAVFRHSLTEGPGHIATYMKANGRDIKVIAIDRGDCVPLDPTAFAGLCFMGGPMSVNDPLPWIPEALSLIRAAMDADIPVIGHCLGGQLMSRALGGVVSANPVKEIGWRDVQLTHPQAQNGSATARASCPSTGMEKRSPCPKAPPACCRRMPVKIRPG